MEWRCIDLLATLRINLDISAAKGEAVSADKLCAHRHVTNYSGLRMCCERWTLTDPTALC